MNIEVFSDIFVERLFHLKRIVLKNIFVLKIRLVFLTNFDNYRDSYMSKKYKKTRLETFFYKKSLFEIVRARRK